MSYLWEGLSYLVNETKLDIKKWKIKKSESSFFMNEFISNSFISGEIMGFIKKRWDNKTYVSYQYIINNKLKIEWNVVEVHHSKNKYELNDKILTIIYNLYKNSACYKPDKCELIQIGFWNTPFIKHLPLDGFTNYFHVNSGATYHYSYQNIGSVYIWREQEWLKTLFHEVIHAFRYDFYMKHFGFCCSSKKLGNEAYVEWFAILLTLFFLSKNKSDFIKKYDNFKKHNRENMKVIKPYFFDNFDRIKVNILGYWVLNSYFFEMPNSIIKQILMNKFHIDKTLENEMTFYLKDKLYKDILKPKKEVNLDKAFLLCVFNETEI